MQYADITSICYMHCSTYLSRSVALLLPPRCTTLTKSLCGPKFFCSWKQHSTPGMHGQKKNSFRNDFVSLGTLKMLEYSTNRNTTLQIFRAMASSLRRRSCVCLLSSIYDLLYSLEKHLLLFPIQMVTRYSLL